MKKRREYWLDPEEDKAIIAEAKKQGRSVKNLAEKIMRDYLQNLKK